MIDVALITNTLLEQFRNKLLFSISVRGSVVLRGFTPDEEITITISTDSVTAYLTHHLPFIYTVPNTLGEVYSSEGCVDLAALRRAIPENLININSDEEHTIAFNDLASNIPLKEIVQHQSRRYICDIELRPFHITNTNNRTFIDVSGICMFEMLQNGEIVSCTSLSNLWMRGQGRALFHALSVLKMDWSITTDLPPYVEEVVQHNRFFKIVDNRYVSKENSNSSIDNPVLLPWMFCTYWRECF